MQAAVRDPDRTGRTPVRDGRRLAWAEWGPAGGVPVVLSPGAATSRALGFGGDVVDELGVRLIAVDRPGLGASDPHPQRTLLDFAEDVRALGLDAPAVVGFSQGAPFALACGAAGVASAIAVVSGTDELAHPAFAGRLDPMLQAIVDDPAGGEAAFAQMTAERMWSTVVATSGPADRAVDEAPAFAAAYRRALEEGFAQGADGYARDTVLAMSRWPFALGAITVPVHLWYGAHDTSPFHSPDFGETLCRRLPNATRHLRHDAGGALLWTHGAEILRELLSSTASRDRSARSG